MSDSQNKEPIAEVRVGESHITLLGTAHVSKASADQVRQLLNSGDYDAVAVELCPSRYNAIMDPDALSRMDLFNVLKEGKASMVAAIWHWEPISSGWQSNSISSRVPSSAPPSTMH